MSIKKPKTIQQLHSIDGFFGRRLIDCFHYHPQDKTKEWMLQTRSTVSKLCQFFDAEQRYWIDRLDGFKNAKPPSASQFIKAVGLTDQEFHFFRGLYYRDYEQAIEDFFEIY